MTVRMGCFARECLFGFQSFVCCVNGDGYLVKHNLVFLLILCAFSGQSALQPHCVCCTTGNSCDHCNYSLQSTSFPAGFSLIYVTACSWLYIRLFVGFELVTGTSIISAPMNKMHSVFGICDSYFVVRKREKILSPYSLC